MKFKALRKKDIKEFVVLDFNKKLMTVYTSEMPRLQPMTASIESLAEIFEGYDLNGYSFDDFEFVELDIIEADVIGADIRNKLTPFNSVIMLYRLLKKRMPKEKKDALKKLLDGAVDRSEKCVKYLSNLL